MSEYRIHAYGEIDTATAPQLREDLQLAIRLHVSHVLVDCAGLTFIDSAGIAVLLEAHGTLEAQGRHLLVTNVGRAPMRAFEVLGLTDLLHYDRVAGSVLTRT
jgi:anti-sigma B factor antagonist